MPTYCYQVQPVRAGSLLDPTPAETEIIGAHFSYLQEHHREGRVVFVGLAMDGVFAVAVFDAPGPDEAEALMLGDPAVREGLVTATVHPFKVLFERPPARPA